MKNFKEIIKNLKAILNTENVLTVFFLIGFFNSLVGLMWFLWLCLGALFSYSLPLFMVALGVITMLVAYGLSYLRR